jgi:hypothetical protein
MTKEEIVREIQRTAAGNAGVPLGISTFEKQTGIRVSDWFGKFWRSWGDAVRDAGFEANTRTPRIDDDRLLERYAQLTRELCHVPSKADLRLAKRRDPTLPSEVAFTRRFGTYADVRLRARDWCVGKPEFSDVASVLGEAAGQSRGDGTSGTRAVDVGFVYLIKHGSRAEYKLGRTSNPVRREGEMRLQLPERVKPVHYIETDDPSGIEAYWHARFASKRKEGEWFALSADDVRAFKKWKRIS